MTQLVFDKEWLVPASEYREVYHKGHIRWPWMDRFSDAFNQWWDSGKPEGEEPMIDDFIPRMTKETQDDSTRI
jgi:hypothetical protein